jgi:thioredoxin-related protein
MSKLLMVLVLMFIVLAKCQDAEKHNLRLVNDEELEDINEKEAVLSEDV